MKSSESDLSPLWRSLANAQCAAGRLAFAATWLWLIVMSMDIAVAQLDREGEGGTSQSRANSASNPAKVNLAGPLKIVKLLWDSNPSNAANTLTRSISTAVARNELDALREALVGLSKQTQAVLASDDHSDIRYAPSLAAAMLDGSLTEAATTIGQALHRVENLDQRQMLWQIWLLTDTAATEEYFLLQIADSQASPGTSGDPQNKTTHDTQAKYAATSEEWTSRLIADALAIRRDWASQMLIEHWSQLSPAAALAAIEPLTANARSMELLVAAIERGDVPKDLLNTNQLRKWLGSDNLELIKRIESIWGKVRIEDDAARQQLVAQTLEQLTHGARGSASRGGVVFDRVCSQCHALHGRGFEVGPNIAGNGRGNLQQLVSNILDPSLVIGEAFQAKTVLTVDGEVVAGLVAAENERYLKLKVQGGKVVEFDKEDIEQVKTSTKSLMPEGVETQMNEQELFDLMAYLCLLKPLGASDNEFIPGTPTDFVEP